jgi:hypothetical protein
VVLALGFFTSARIAEQVRSGIQSLPRGQRYAGMAMGLTLPQTYRYVLLPMAFRIIIPPLTSESMNIFKNSSVAFAVSRRADDVRHAGAGGNLARHRDLPGGDRAVLHLGLGHQPHHGLHRAARAGARHDRQGREMNLDFRFYNWGPVPASCSRA